MKIKQVTLRIYTEEANYKYTMGDKKIWRFERMSDTNPEKILLLHSVDNREQLENVIAGIERDY